MGWKIALLGSILVALVWGMVSAFFDELEGFTEYYSTHFTLITINNRFGLFGSSFLSLR
jgi:hypothetical protein